MLHEIIWYCTRSYDVLPQILWKRQVGLVGFVTISALFSKHRGLKVVLKPMFVEDRDRRSTSTAAARWNWRLEPTILRRSGRNRRGKLWVGSSGHRSPCARSNAAAVSVLIACIHNCATLNYEGRIAAVSTPHLYTDTGQGGHITDLEDVDMKLGYNENYLLNIEHPVNGVCHVRA